jgi:rhamnosyltransferase
MGPVESLGAAARRVLERTYVVVVTFHPDLDRIRRQFAILAQEGAAAVIVVDNHSGNQQVLSELAAAHGFDVVRLTSNVGVAAAQNVGIERVRQVGGDYVVLFDQDSLPASGFIAQLAFTFSTRTGARVAGIGPQHSLDDDSIAAPFARFRWFGFEKISCPEGAHDVHEVDSLISSGAFIPMATIDVVGQMWEELFIDKVDSDWFLRARHLGYQAFGCCGATMSHTIGTRSLRVWFGGWRTTSVHAPERYFYIYRNSLWLYRQPYVPRKFVSADLVSLTKLLLSMTIISPRRRKVRFALRGIAAGLRAPQRAG